MQLYTTNVIPEVSNRESIAKDGSPIKDFGDDDVQSLGMTMSNTWG